MSATYLVRFDDICPTMNWRVWFEIERVLSNHSIRPILAVVPDNRDLTLRWDRPHPDFWAEVRRWESQGATIALHGYQHLYASTNSGIVGKNPYSEFAGLDRAVQQRKIDSALTIFEREGIRPTVWIAPGHSFDAVTLELLAAGGIRIVSDGRALFPYTDDRGILWVPQQLDRFKSRSVGVWTVCYHHGWWTIDDVRRFERDIESFAPRIAALPEVAQAYSARRWTRADDWLCRSMHVRERAASLVRQALTSPLRAVARRAVATNSYLK